VPLTDEENQGEIRQGYPFGRLRRARGDVFDLVEIVMDKYGGPAFSMCAGTVSEAGFLHPAVGHVPADRVWASHLSTGYGVYQVPWLLKQFRMARWPWQEVTESDIDNMVAKIAAFAPREIDSALLGGRIGPHIRKW
jgi:hypothetical protein